MSIASWLTNYFKRTAVRSRLRSDFLLSPSALAHEVMCERLRVDRNGSVLAILRSTQSVGWTDPILQTLSERLQLRLRITDSAGISSDGRLLLLLPDTPLSGAMHVADALRQQLSTCVAGLEFEVGLYPDLPADDDSDSDLRGSEQSAELVFDSAESPWPAAPRSQPGGVLQGPLAATATVASPMVSSPQQWLRPGESLFARQCPWWKRAIDVVGSAVGLVVLSPLIAIAAVLVKATSPGGAFFSQQREGLGGRSFRIYKLRTMHANAESLKAGLRPFSEQDGPAFKMAADPRITTVGRWLRKTSLDELPQLWNVFKGDMSLVGPRPLPLDESQGCQPWQRQRLAVRPGLTCIWQIRGRNTVTFDEWMRMDLRYLRRRSWWYDLYLIACTGPALIARREGQSPKT